MIQAPKLESLTVIGGTVAHDFNNLLTIIIQHAADALKHLDADQESIRDHLQNILFAVNQASDLTRQMLSHSRRSPTEFTPFNLTYLLRENMHFCATSIPKAITFQSLLTDELPTILGNPGQIEQVLMNLILNAVDAIGERAGKITVTTTAEEVAMRGTQLIGHCNGEWFGGPVKPGTYVCLEVGDNGCGMDEMTQKKIFEPFFTTKATGCGLGLAGVLDIVQAHGGAIHVRSALEVGTTFRLFFPVSAPATQPWEERTLGESVVARFPAQTETVNSARASHSRFHFAERLTDALVLIIEDDTTVRQATAGLLEASAIRTLDASDGATGLKLFQQHIADIDLVLLDLSMPGMDGGEVLHALWAMKPGVRTVVLSGYDRYEALRRINHPGEIAFLQKPYHIEQLMHVIGEQLVAPLSIEQNAPAMGFITS